MAAAKDNEQPAPADQDAMSVDDLARAVLDKKIRLRVAGLCRLAEAVLARVEPVAKSKKPKKPKKPSKSGGKKRKLAKIPGQKG